ncbi:MAG: DUF1385 domain-containing protein [Oscillospiraceae bacterium]|nr:DUF1385 domain-containing protein [Oscillospiraceae bacterium]
MKKTSIGGQALLEGVMMRGPSKYAAVVRSPGGLLVKEEAAPYPKDRHPILGWVFIRGVCNFVQSMSIGMKALFWSADQTVAEGSNQEAEGGGKSGQKGIGKGTFAISMALALVLVVGLFTYLPTLLSGLIPAFQKPADAAELPVHINFLRNLFETFLRLVILLTYMLLVSQTKDIKRTFAYHGAEHKSIACYEAGDELTVENARKNSRFHPRCGTSFLLTVVLISMVVFLLISLPLQMLAWDNAFLRMGVRLALLPFVVAISYEVNRLVGRSDNILSRIVRAPGLLMQRITTREPDDGMLEVALDALKRVVPAEEGRDAWGTE